MGIKKASGHAGRAAFAPRLVFGCESRGVVLPLLIVALSSLAGCSTKPPIDYARPLPPGSPALFRVTDPNQYPDFSALFQDRASALVALDESLSYFDKPSSRDHFPYRTSDRAVTHQDQVESLLLLRRLLEESRDPGELAQQIQQRFDVYSSVGWDNGSGEVFFTAYYTPIFAARRAPDAEFRYPLYRRPADLVSTVEGQPLGRRTQSGEVVPYYTRAEIDQGQLLAGQELVYLADPFEAYVVHVQGSAWLRLGDGSEFHVGYAGKTDRPYRSLGQELIQRGKIAESELSLARIAEYLDAHPHEERELLDANPSYVFFAETEPGPFGSLGTRVTARHTIATDKSVFPRGGAVVAVAQLPGEPSWHTGLYFDQDTGGAIRSAGRADLYLGVGREAERQAGHTRSLGRLFYLFARTQ